jgi:small subunit ribosomal protein S5
VIAGGTVRAIAELAGIKNLLTKSMRSHNPHNLVKAVFNALKLLRYPEEIAEDRGVPVEKLGYRPVGIFSSSKKEKGNA